MLLPRSLFRVFVVPAALIVIILLTLFGWPSRLPFQRPTSPLVSTSQSQRTSTPEGQQPKHIGHPQAGYAAGAYREILSVSTADRKFFKIDFSPHRGINPNVIPHPTLKDHWLVMGMFDSHVVENSAWSAELVCTATFKGDVLACIDPPLILSIGKTPVRAPPSSPPLQEREQIE